MRIVYTKEGQATSEAGEAQVSEPSRKQANEVLRVLAGEQRKFTCRAHLPGGQTLEFQSDGLPLIKWNDEARQLFLNACVGESTYNTVPVMAWPDGAILLTEQNPGWKGKE